MINKSVKIILTPHKKKRYSERRRKQSFISLIQKFKMIIRRNDTLKGDGNRII